MILRGILDRSLGGFVCLRGFASLGDLYDISQYDPAYQRELIKEHGAEIAHFYNDREYLFFPELVLGVSIQPTSSDEDEGRRFYNYANSYKDPKDSDSRIFKFSWCTIRVKEDVTASPTDRRVGNITRIGIIDLKDLQKGESKLLSRIDGNHRLSAIEYKDNELNGDDFRGLNAPFCLMLFRDQTDNDQHSRVIFHNINYKSIPLEKEENLRLILDDAQKLYADQVLKTNPSFGPAYYVARKLNNALQLQNLRGLKQAFQKPLVDNNTKEVKRTVLLNLCHLLEGKGKLLETNNFIQDVIEAVQAVNEIYKQYDQLRNSHSQAVLLLMIYYKLTATVVCETFKNWVLSNYIHLSNDLDAIQLLNVFESILNAKKHEIFVSMQFSEDTKPHYDAIEEAANTVSQDHKIALKVTRVDRLEKGHSYQIPTEILDLVNTSGLLIADLTHGNKNVYHEIGYMMGLNRGKGFEQNNFIFILRDNEPNQGDTDKEVGFNLRDWQQIRFKGNNPMNLRNKLIESIKAFYNL